MKKIIRTISVATQAVLSALIPLCVVSAIAMAYSINLWVGVFFTALAIGVTCMELDDGE